MAYTLGNGLDERTVSIMLVLQLLLSHQACFPKKESFYIKSLINSYIGIIQEYLFFDLCRKVG